MIKSTYLFCLFSFLLFNSFGQNIIMGDAGFPQSNPANCTTFGTNSTNFIDPGDGGNYLPNYNDTIVFCPELTLGTKMSITFGINAGYEFNVHGSDSIYVFDGPTTSSPLLGVHNSATDPNGFTYQATWDNPSGCLTIVFVTDGANEGTGWLANVQCGNQFQPFEPHIEAYINGVGPNALNPLDTGFVDVCFGDSILFIARPIFPNSLEATGYGYSQDVNSNINFQWTITAGGTYANNDSVWFTPPARSGYLIDVKATDMFPQNERIRCKVRVSLLPSFVGTGPLEDSVCLGSNTVLLGGVTTQDTVGVTIPPGSFEMGGNYAGLTYLPDGSGQNYQAPITISGFPEGATIQDAQSLNQVCITMEHSYLGDLEIWLACPNGTIVGLVNSYNPGFLPGGISGGGRFLGHPFDDGGGGGPGIGWEYCFSSVFNTTGTMMGTFPGNTIPVPFIAGTPNLSAGNSVSPDNTYQPETTFAGFAGCPINGNWTIFVRDNLATDDGYIFEWGLFFDESYFPGLGSYNTSADTSWWSFDPTIISGLNGDTLIVVQPTQIGTYTYQFNVIDNFGCPYDTIVSFVVVEGPEIFPDTITCNSSFQVSGTVAFDGGVWSSTDPAITFSNPTSENPLISTSIPGTYTISFLDNECTGSVSTEIQFLSDIAVDIPDAIVCAGNNYSIVPIYSSNGTLESANYTISWNNGSIDTTISANEPGNYVVTVSNACVTDSDSLLVYDQPAIFTDTLACDLTHQVAGTYAPNGGLWASTDPAISFSNTSIPNPVINTSTAGIYNVTLTDPICQTQLTATVEFPPKMEVLLIDTTICIGTEFTLIPFYFNTPPVQNGYVNPINFTWDNGNIDPVRIINAAGTYTATVSNQCYSKSATSDIDLKPCDIEVPNIINLSSSVGNNLFFVQYNGLAEFNCLIFNRWGNLIYEYSDPAGTWDGKTEDGNLVSEGTYFYKINARFDGLEEGFVKHGFVVVKY